MMMLITAIIGITMLLVFLGILVWWIKSVPLTIIVIGGVVLMLYDFVRTLRAGDSGAGR